VNAKLAISRTKSDHAYKRGCPYFGCDKTDKENGSHSEIKYPKKLGQACSDFQLCKIKTCGRRERKARKP
jgi:hypothetical protein